MENAVTVTSKFYKDGDFVAEISDSDGELIRIVIVAELSFDGHTYFAYYREGESSDKIDILESFTDDDNMPYMMSIDDDVRYQTIAQAFIQELNRVTEPLEGGVN